MESQALDLDKLDFAGVDLLKDVMAVIAATRPENGAVLLENYRNAPNNKAITALSNLVWGVPPGGEEGEFTGAVNQLLKLAKESRMSALIEKVSRGESLTQDEMKEYKMGGKL